MGDHNRPVILTAGSDTALSMVFIYSMLFCSRVIKRIQADTMGRGLTTPLACHTTSNATYMKSKQKKLSGL